MPKIVLPENIQKLKEQLDTNNNIVDYFFVCGVPPSICTNELLYKVSSDEDIKNNLKDILKPKILCKFPEFDKTSYEVGEELVSFCFPEGFDILYNNSSKPERKIFSIILDNNSTSIEYEYHQKYLTCVLFYEQLYQYKKLQQQIDMIENNKEENLDSIDEGNIINMRSNLEEEKIYRHRKMQSTIIPPMNKLQRSGKITEDMLNSIKKNKEYENMNHPLNKLKYYYIPKCICLLSVHPNIKLYQKILCHIYEYGLSQNKIIPLEKIITNLIIEVPLPPRGLYSVNYNYNFECLEQKEANGVLPLESTENNKLLVSEINLSKFNKSLSFNCIMQTIKHILLNSKILFFSQNLTTLSDTIISFLSIIFPFKYTFQVASFLQKEHYTILESPTPYIMGINEEYNKDFFTKNEISLECMNFFVVDLDSEKEDNFDLFTDEEFPELPTRLVSNLEKEIKSMENINNKNNKNKTIDMSSGDINKEKNSINSIKEFNEKYQEKFFNFFCELLRGYEEFLNWKFYDSDYIDIKALFHCEKFVKCSYHNQSEYNFYAKFVDISQLFMDFILKNMIPKNNSQLMDLLILNNYYNSQKKKKSKTIEPEQDVYAIKNKYIVPKPKEITNEEKEKIIKERLTLVKNGQLIKYNKSKEDSEIKFDYTLFPLLSFNIYCNNDNVNQYIYPPDYREEIEVLNMESISKSSLGKNINRAMEMKNYLYLTWLEIWAYTFGNNDFGEKHYRFDQMLDVLDKVIHHEMNILNLMFDVLNKYNEKDMMLKLYKKLLSLKLNPSTTIYDIMYKNIDRDNMKNIIDESKKKDMKLTQLKYNDYKNKTFRERTFLSIEDNLPLETKPKFYFDYDCINCNDTSTKINLYQVSKNFEGIRNDTLWVKCSVCEEFILPQIKVKFGLDFINDQSQSTSIKEYVLHSPYNLKINIKQACNTQFRYLDKNEKMKLKISNFKAEFQPLFWDFIWYCIIHNLDYNILLPYSKTLEEEKKTHCYNPNINIFEVLYDDSTFKENQNKIERISTIIKNSEENKGNKKFNVLKKSTAIRLEIIGKIKIIPIEAIKEKKEEDAKKYKTEEKKDIVINKEKSEVKSEEKKDDKDNTGKKKKISMFDIFNNINKKIESVNKEENTNKDNKKEEDKKEEIKKVEIKKEEIKKEVKKEEEDDDEEEEEESDEEEENKKNKK